MVGWNSYSKYYFFNLDTDYYNPYLSIPFFLAPMASGTIACFAIKLEIIRPMIAQIPWTSPIGIGAFIRSRGDWKAPVCAIFCVLVAFIIYYPFARSYDACLVKQEVEKEEQNQ